MISRQVSLACDQKNPALESRPLNNKSRDTSSPTPQKMATVWKVSSRIPGARERTFARAVICTVQSGLGMEVGSANVARPACGACELVPRHSDYDWLILSQFRMGSSPGPTTIW